MEAGREGEGRGPQISQQGMASAAPALLSLPSPIHGLQLQPPPNTFPAACRLQISQQGMDLERAEGILEWTSKGECCRVALPSQDRYVVGADVHKQPAACGC